MSEAALLAVFALLGSVVAAIIQLVLGKSTNKVTGIGALTDDQREFADQLLKERKELRDRLDVIEKEYREFRAATETNQRRMVNRMDAMERTLIANNLPIPPNGIH